VKRFLAAAALVLATVMAIPAAAHAQDSQCPSLKFRTNFRLNGAMQHITTADASAFPDVKRSRYTEAKQVLTESSAAGGADAFTTWYLFGRAYAGLGDLAGVDSSFSKAAALAPNDAGCTGEMNRIRHNLWVPLQAQAATLIQDQKYDSALVLLRKSNLIYREDPGGYINMASAYMSLNHEDSAAMMYRMAAHAGTGAERQSLRETAAFNAARLYQRANKYPAAESAYRDYINMKPHDMEARGGLASLLVLMNRTPEASAIYDSMLANADSLDSFSTFAIGVALFRQAVADSAPGNAAHRREEFEQSAHAFEIGLRKNPGYRDALFNLTNTYLGASDTAKVLEAAQRLAAVDSLNRQVLTLLARAQQMNGRRNDVVATLSKRDSLSMEVAMARFVPGDTTATLRGAVTNLRGREHPGFNLTIEFLNAQQAVVTTEHVDVPTLNSTGQPGSSYDFTIQTSGHGIIAYRYKIS
jgi:tetratricopeptide (TPR) repeat protein